MERQLNEIAKDEYEVRLITGALLVYKGDVPVFFATFRKSEGIEVAYELMEDYIK